jgi:hypothetical protein
MRVASALCSPGAVSGSTMPAYWLDLRPSTDMIAGSEPSSETR